MMKRLILLTLICLNIFAQENAMRIDHDLLNDAYMSEDNLERMVADLSREFASINNDETRYRAIEYFGNIEDRIEDELWVHNHLFGDIVRCTYERPDERFIQRALNCNNRAADQTVAQRTNSRNINQSAQ